MATSLTVNFIKTDSITDRPQQEGRYLMAIYRSITVAKLFKSKREPSLRMLPRRTRAGHVHCSSESLD